MLGSRARHELKKLWTSIRLGLTPPEDYQVDRGPLEGDPEFVTFVFLEVWDSERTESGRVVKS